MYTCMYTEICYPAYSVKQVSTSRGSYDGMLATGLRRNRTLPTNRNVWKQSFLYS